MLSYLLGIICIMSQVYMHVNRSKKKTSVDYPSLQYEYYDCPILHCMARDLVSSLNHTSIPFGFLCAS